MTGNSLSPSELTALEHAFAADPSSEAYRPLAEAYLSMGRFMEAMVVCKKGVKAHPGTPHARVLLGRVYLRQGKDRKALDEIEGGLAVGPDFLEGLRLAAELHAKLGDRDAAAERLRRAERAHPGDPEIRRIAGNLGVDLSPPPPPAPPPPTATPAPPVAAAPQVQAGAGQGQAPYAPPPAPPGPPPAGHIPVLTPVAPAAAPATAQVAPQAPGPVAAPPPRRRVAPPPAFDASRWEQEEEREEQRRQGGARRGMLTLVGTVVVLSLALGGWFGYSRWDAQRKRDIARSLEETGEQINADTYASYRKASESASRILELDPDNYVAHAYLAYIDALRWGEQGEGDEYKRRALANLEAAKGSGEQHSRTLAAEAYVRYFSGDAAGAVKGLTDFLATGQKSGLLTTTLGIILMNKGDLDEALKTLKDAQTLEPNSVRVLAALGQLHRRLGRDAEAWTFYDSALRLDKNHADSLLGKALLILDASDAGRPPDAQEKLLAEAEAQIQKVLQLPEGEISVRQLALGKFAQAQLHFARAEKARGEKLEAEAFTLDPTNADMRLLRGRRLLREGEVEGAVRDIRQAIEIDSGRASFYIDLSRALLRKEGGAKEAVAALRNAERSFPASGRIQVLLGDALRAQSDVPASRAAYEKAIGLERSVAGEARARLGRLLREQKDFAAARGALEKALQEMGLGASGPGVALTLTELGRLEEEAPDGDYQKAYERYRRAIEADPGSAAAYFFIGRMLSGQKSAEQKQKGKEALENYLRLAPQGEFAADARSLIG